MRATSAHGQQASPTRRRDGVLGDCAFHTGEGEQGRQEQWGGVHERSHHQFLLRSAGTCHAARSTTDSTSDARCR